MQAWKYAISEDGEKALIDLDIPDNVNRVMYTDRGRASYAIVKGIYTYSYGDMDFTNEIQKAFSAYDRTFTYKTGTCVYADRLDLDPINMCSNGIHFFKDRDVAIFNIGYDEWYDFRVKAFNRYLEKQKAKSKSLWRILKAPLQR